MNGDAFAGKARPRRVDAARADGAESPVQEARRAKKDAPVARWTSVILRTLHLAGVVVLGAAVLAQGDPTTGIVLALTSGLALAAAEWWRHPQLWREVAGLFMPVKLALLAVIPYVPGSAGLVFWTVLVASSLIAHAPLTFRRRRLIG